MELMRRSLSSILCTKLDNSGLLDNKILNNSGKELSFFVRNGSKLLEEFIAQWDGRSKISLRNFSSKELAQATHNFDINGLVTEDSDYRMYRGSFEKRQILVKKYGFGYWAPSLESYVVRDIVISSLMSFHKNVLKLIGYCLDYEYSALVYQSTDTFDLLGHQLLNTKLTWESKLSLALDIANVLVYLHTGFQTPIIHRNLELAHVVMDKYGTAKLMDFSLCISFPRGECQVEDQLVGTLGYAEPKYIATGVITEKSDVYSFGVVLFELLTGRQRPDLLCTKNTDSWLDSLRIYIETDEIEIIVNDDRMTEGDAKQIRAFAALALKCIGDERESRPGMVDVAKELRRIQRSVCSSPTS